MCNNHTLSDEYLIRGQSRGRSWGGGGEGGSGDDSIFRPRIIAFKLEGEKVRRVIAPKVRHALYHFRQIAIWRIQPCSIWISVFTRRAHDKLIEAYRIWAICDEYNPQQSVPLWGIGEEKHLNKNATLICMHTNIWGRLKWSILLRQVEYESMMRLSYKFYVCLWRKNVIGILIQLLFNQINPILIFSCLMFGAFFHTMENLYDQNTATNSIN